MRIDRLLMIGLSILATSPVFAAPEGCHSIAVDKERLACFDRDASPGQSKRPHDGPTKNTASSKFVDPVDSLKAENDRVSARLKGICRGC
jgi:hypothetical protein